MWLEGVLQIEMNKRQQQYFTKVFCNPYFATRILQPVFCNLCLCIPYEWLLILNVRKLN